MQNLLFALNLLEMVLKQIFLPVLSLVFSGLLSAQTIPVSGDWKFITGDDVSWKNENVDDRNWQSVRVPAFWEATGFSDYDGFAWYRTRFSIPDGFITFWGFHTPQYLTIRRLKVNYSWHNFFLFLKKNYGN